MALTAAATPAAAQVELSGVWQPRYLEDFLERIPGPELRDYLGLPINDSARQFADSWDPSRITLPEEQCRVHVSPYILRGPTNLRIFVEKDPKTQDVIAVKMYTSTYEQTRTIWMDGRRIPALTPRTWMGFSTGRWDGDMFIVETTHLKAGMDPSQRYCDERPGHLHGVHRAERRPDVAIGVLVDPVYLAEPLVKSEEFTRAQRDLPAQTWLWVCEPVVEIATQTEGDIPAYLPGEHPFKGEFETKHHLPEFAIRGGPETMYPEFQARIREWLAKNPRPAPGGKK